MRYIPFIALSLLLFSACADVERKKQLSALEELNGTLDSIQLQLTDHRCDTLATMLERVHTVRDVIRKHYDSDTLSLEFAQQLDVFKQMTFDLEQYLLLQSQLDSLLVPEQESLSRLQSDISNGSGAETKYASYVEAERKRVLTLQSLGDSLVANRIRSFRAYDAVYNEMHNYAFLLIDK